jgi:hypothetical protein
MNFPGKNVIIRFGYMKQHTLKSTQEDVLMCRYPSRVLKNGCWQTFLPV